MTEKVDHEGVATRLLALSLEIDSKNYREVVDADLVRWAFAIQREVAALSRLEPHP